MSHKFRRSKIGEDIYFSSVYDDKFKSCRISIYLFTPLREKTAAVNAIVPFLLRRGCKQYPDFYSLNKKLSLLYGATLYADVRRIGETQVLSLSLQCIDSEYTFDGYDALSDAAELVLDLFKNPKICDGKFDDTDFKVEQKSLLELIESEINDKRSYALSRLERHMFESEHYGVNRLGETDKVQALTSADAAVAYKNLVETSRIEVMASGKGNMEKLEQLFESSLCDISRDIISKCDDIEVVTDIKSVKDVTERLEIGQAKLVMGFRAVPGDSERDINAMRTAVALYGGTPFSKLFENVREKLGLCYYCAARFDRIKGIMLVDSGLEHSNKQVAVDEILAQLKSLKDGDFEDEKLGDTIKSLQNGFMSMNDSLHGLEAWYLTQIYTGKEISPSMAAQDISLITREDVINAAGRMNLDTVYFLTEKGE